MIKTIITNAVLSFLILQSCRAKCKPGIIAHGNFSGYAIAFYHKPISGSGCEVKFIPTCQYEIVRGDSLPKFNYNDISSSEGVSVVAGLDDSTFAELFNKSKRLSVVNHDSLASEFRYIYVCL